MTDEERRNASVKRLVLAGVLEAACIGAGVVAWSMTGNWIWIVTGVVGSLGVSLPAIIQFIRERKEEERR